MAKMKVKKSMFKTLSNFFIGVKNESKKVIWTSKNNLIKYSIATIAFMIFTSLFFIGADLLIALVTYVKELIG